MKEFNINEAKAGAPVITRNGRKVRILCYDRKSGQHPGKIIALVMGHSNRFEQIVQYDLEGNQVDLVTSLDLFMRD